MNASQLGQRQLAVAPSSRCAGRRRLAHSLPRPRAMDPRKDYVARCALESLGANSAASATRQWARPSSEMTTSLHSSKQLGTLYLRFSVSSARARSPSPGTCSGGRGCFGKRVSSALKRYASKKCPPAGSDMAGCGNSSFTFTCFTHALRLVEHFASHWKKISGRFAGLIQGEFHTNGFYL